MTETTTAPTNVLSNADCYPTIGCNDINTAREFYNNTLGLTIVNETDEQGILFSSGNTNVYVYPREGHTPPANTVCSFNVNDVPGTVQALQGAGVTFEEYDFPGLTTVNGVADMGDGSQSAWFKDPDGNIIAIGNVL